jgi:hypothetical protein
MIYTWSRKGLWEMKEKEYKTGLIKITVSYGYDIHSIEFSKRTYDRILTGQYVKIKGPKFVCEGVNGKFPQDYWVFNREGTGSIYVYAVDGRDIYIGEFNDGNVWVDQLVDGDWIELEPEVEDIDREEKTPEQLKAERYLTPEEAEKAFSSVGQALAWGKGIILGGTNGSTHETFDAFDSDPLTHTSIILGMKSPRSGKKNLRKKDKPGKETIELREDQPDGWTWGEMLNEVAELYRSKKWRKAAQLAERVCKKGENDIDPDQASQLEAIGDDYFEQGRFSEAEKAYMEVLDIRERTFGHVHPLITRIIGKTLEIFPKTGREEPKELNSRYNEAMGDHEFLTHLRIFSHFYSSFDSESRRIEEE